MNFFLFNGEESRGRATDEDNSKGFPGVQRGVWARKANFRGGTEKWEIEIGLDTTGRKKPSKKIEFFGIAWKLIWRFLHGDFNYKNK